ncbi:EAL domain-containing protein [Pseudomonas poae]|nr:EAL domain-containing protein [Pseudomonas poae]
MFLAHISRPDTFTSQEIQSAIQRNEFRAYYQPQVELTSYEVSGLEVLARWHHPRLGLMAPHTFLPSIMTSGLFNELSYSLIKQALDTQNTLFSQGFDLPISINLEPSQLGDTCFINTLIAQVHQGSVNRRPLTIEITESRDENLQSPKYSKNIAAIKDVGWSVAIDDFGTGYSSFERICQLKCSELKIDQSFVRNMMVDDNYSKAIKYIVALACDMGLKSVAEGVETPQQLIQLQNIGCEHGQGYLFSAPLSSEKIKAWCVRWSGAALL